MNPVTIGDAKIYQGNCLDVLRTMPDQSVHCCVTSPPYFGLRDYGNAAQIGLEQTPAEYVARLVDVFREVRRVLRDDGTLWLNIGDSYAMSTKGAGGQGKQHTNAGSIHKSRAWRIPPELKPKDLIGIPWRVAFALQADGWWLRQDIIWHKPNPMPESVRDRCTKAHEYIFLLTKSEQYYYDADVIREPHARLWNETNGGNMADVGHKKNGKIESRQTHPKGYPLPNPLGRNRRSVWTVATKPYKGAHFATFPPALIEPCILAGCPDEDGVVLDPFNGAGTTGIVALQHGRRYIGIELNPEYINLAVDRIGAAVPRQMAMGF